MTQKCAGDSTPLREVASLFHDPTILSTQASIHLQSNVKHISVLMHEGHSPWQEGHGNSPHEFTRDTGL